MIKHKKTLTIARLGITSYENNPLVTKKLRDIEKHLYIIPATF